MPEYIEISSDSSVSVDLAGFYYVYAYTSDSCKSTSDTKEVKISKSSEFTIQGLNILCPCDSVTLF